MESDNNVISSLASTSRMLLTGSAAASSQALITDASVLEPDISSPNASISDKYFRSQKRIDSLWPIQAIDPVLHNSKRSSLTSGEYIQAKDHEELHLSTTHVKVGQSDSAREDKLSNTKMAGSKFRCRFSNERRKEVQEVRKLGACIRCRMLKKPVRLV